MISGSVRGSNSIYMFFYIPPDFHTSLLKWKTFGFRWDDDVVFKNCAKGIDETKKDKRFVNDTLRSEFHKKFMEKYIK